MRAPLQHLDRRQDRDEESGWKIWPFGEETVQTAHTEELSGVREDRPPVLEVLGLKAYKMRISPKLTKKQRAQRLQFCKERKNWTVEEWKRVLFSDESPFQLFHHPSRQNERVWAENPAEVPNAFSGKFPPKLIAWGMMSYEGLSQLHVIPQKTLLLLFVLRPRAVPRRSLAAP